MEGDIGQLLRYQFYGRQNIVSPSPAFDRLAPNIGHVVWIGGGTMDFMFFVCVLSLLHVVKVDVVYLHGDAPITGHYWDLLVDTGQNVQFVLREDVGQVFCLCRI